MSTYLTMQEIKEMSSEEVAANVEAVNRSLKYSWDGGEEGYKRIVQESKHPRIETMADVRKLTSEQVASNLAAVNRVLKANV
jgi:hypothetical protein